MAAVAAQSDVDGNPTDDDAQIGDDLQDNVKQLRLRTCKVNTQRVKLLIFLWRFDDLPSKHAIDRTSVCEGEWQNEKPGSPEHEVQA